MDTDSMIESKHGWGKDFDANCTNFREGGTRRVGDQRSRLRYSTPRQGATDPTSYGWHSELVWTGFMGVNGT